MIIVNISFAQDKIKFGYHSPSGKVNPLDVEEIKKNKTEQQFVITKKTIQIDDVQINNVTNKSDSIFTLTNDTLIDFCITSFLFIKK